MNYSEKFSKYIGIMEEALNHKDFDTYDAAKSTLDGIITECRAKEMLTNEARTSNFGVLNYIIEGALPSLLKTNKSVIGKIMKTIKEDKNLINQFRFYNTLKNFNGENSIAFVKESLELVKEEINQQTAKKSATKLSNILLENKIIPEELVDKKLRTFYENCDYLMTRKKKITNLTEMEDRIKAVAQFISEHKKENIEESKTNALKLIDDYEKSLSVNLNEAEQSLVQDIIDFKRPQATARKKTMFEQLKNECLNKINVMLSEASSEENEKLKLLKEKINGKVFNEETIVKDIAQMLEIRDVLFED